MCKHLMHIKVFAKQRKMVRKCSFFMSDICTLLFEHVQHVRTFLIYVLMVKDLYKLESLQNWSCIHL